MKENLADITAKAGSQSILSSTLGTAIGVAIAAAVGNDYNTTVTAFFTCACLNATTTYMSLRQVTMNSLNLARLDYIFHDYLKKKKKKENNDNDLDKLSILTPMEMRNKEVRLGAPNIDIPPLSIGTDLSALQMNNLVIDFQTCLDYFKEERYMIVIEKGEPFIYSMIYIYIYSYICSYVYIFRYEEWTNISFIV